MVESRGTHGTFDPGPRARLAHHVVGGRHDQLRGRTMITWNLIRAAGIGAYLMLWASVAWGLVSTTSVFGRKIPKATTIALHQAFSTSGLLLLAAHLIFILRDTFVKFTWLDLFIPFHASFRPF